MELRRLGHTTYILRAAIRDPHVIIVCASADMCKQLKNKYIGLRNSIPWYKRIFLSKLSPMFMTKAQILEMPNIPLTSYDLPVVYDNYLGD